MGLRNEEKERFPNGRPSHMRNPVNGRIFITTDALANNPKLEPVYDYTPEKPAPESEPVVTEAKVAEAPVEFDLGKATKQQIVNTAKVRFDVELEMTDTLKVLREKFKDLAEGQNNDAGGDADKQSGE